MRLSERHLEHQRIAGERSRGDEARAEIQQQQGEAFIGASLAQPNDPVVEPAFFFEHLPDTT